jgi:hypothetical protein
MTTLRLAALNLAWQLGREAKSRQRRQLREGGYDVVVLQEARRADLVPDLVDAFDWCEHSLAPATHRMVLGVAILGRGGIARLGRQQLAPSEFANAVVYPELARWFHERHLAVDVRLPDGQSLRVLGAHATPGTSAGPGTPAGRVGVGQRKPWFHTRLAHWMAGWSTPFVFAIDANTPRRETLAPDETEFHIPSASDAAGMRGEDVLLGAAHQRPHGARDLWRAWLDAPGGTMDRASVPADGPLARSHLTGGSWYRYDHLWATHDVQPTAMSYRFDEDLSDHALIEATLSL